jgi:glycosyltransferase involved in cell wall biosynthesis
MNRTADCAAVIPCLNEAATIGALIGDVRRHLPAVFVVDDGSTDATAVRAKQAGAEVLRHPVSLGKGAALQTGWQHARNREFKWALTMDGDGQHSPDDIPAFLSCAEQTFAKLIVGNRMANAKQMPRLRRWVNRWMSERLSRIAGQPLPDSQCGFRLIDLEALSVVATATNHFEIESAVLLDFARGGFRIEFLPVQVIYKTEQSKINPLADTVRWFYWWWRARTGTRNAESADFKALGKYKAS